MNIIEVSQFSFAYPGGTDVLHQINLSIEAGEFVLVCGASGSGKTTLLRCMKSQIAPIGRVSGSITQLPAKEIGFVFQNPDNQIVTDTVRHELSFGLENMGLPGDTIRRRTAETALFFGMDEWMDASVHAISGGQKQLLNLAAVIAMRPKLLILDEPTSQLDPCARKNFLELLVRVNRELGIAVLLSEHNLEQVLGVSDRVLFMKQGTIVCADLPVCYARYILCREPKLERSLPAAARIAAVLEREQKQEGRQQILPLTVRDGRRMLKECEEEGINLQAILEHCCRKEQPKEDGELLLRVDHIWFRYHRQTAFVLRGLELCIKKGEIHAVLGGNGSGKTTLLSILGKRLFADKGKIRLGNCGMPKIGLLTQNPKGMFTCDSVGEELKQAGCREEFVRRLGLHNVQDAHPYDLSGGEQQRLGLLLVMAKSPELLLLDEPTKGLDITWKEEVGAWLAEYAAQGNGVVCVTHDVEFAATYADVCSLLADGEVLVTEGTKEFFWDNAFYTTDMVRVLRGFGNQV